jgi:aminoglycoside 6'-N-acetyltransferase I
MIHIRSAEPEDEAEWLAMRQALWPEMSSEGHADEIARYFSGQLRIPLEVLLAFEEESGGAIGFAELSIRSWAAGCHSERVAYLEGWYVVPKARRRGVGRTLVTAAEAWAREQGCVEFGSDALLDNHVSFAAHMALGFLETARIRCFRKVLMPGEVDEEALSFEHRRPNKERGI